MSILPFGDYAGDFYGDGHRRWENTRGASLCSGKSFRLGYRASGQNEPGTGFDGVSGRPQAGRIRTRRCYPRFDFPMPQAKLEIQSSLLAERSGVLISRVTFHMKKTFTFPLARLF